MPETTTIKKPITTTSRALLFALAASIVIIVLLVLSGFRTLNPYLLLVVIAAASVFLYYYFKRPKQHDIYRILDDIRSKHFEKMGYGVDTSNFQAIPVTDEITYVYLPNEAMTFDIRGNLVRGIVNRHILKVYKEMEKSRLFDVWQKTAGAEARVRQQAESVGIDIGSLGLE